MEQTGWNVTSNISRIHSKKKYECLKQNRQMPPTHKLYSSWNSHLQTHWGKATWDAIFLLAADYPHAQDCVDDVELTKETVALKRRMWKQFFMSLPGVLSCPVCGEHFRKYMERNNGKQFNEALEDRDKLFEWLHKCKHEVNRRTNRKSISIDKVKSKYISPCKKVTKPRITHRA